MPFTYTDAIFLYPSLWRVIHICALVLPMDNESRSAFTDFMNSLIVLMPDVEARYSLALWMDSHKISQSLHTNDKLFRWTYNLHQFVNQLRLKEGMQDPSLIDNPSFSEVKTIYSPDKLTKTFWSTSMWRVIHGLAAVYPVNTSRNGREAVAYKQLIRSLVYVLPCAVCREHFKTNLPTMPITNYVTKRIRLFYYTYQLHELVNSQTKDANISWTEAKTLYKLI